MNTKSLKDMTEADFDEVLACVKSMPVEIVQDHIADRLDELADLAEYWKKWRSNKKTPQVIRGAMITLSQEISALYAMESVNVRVNVEGSRTGRISGKDNFYKEGGSGYDLAI